jgi:Tat protein secretion system quality control protein TatD with DNase activity
MELIDTHCHLTFEPLAGDVAGVVERSRAMGVTRGIALVLGLAGPLQIAGKG